MCPKDSQDLMPSAVRADRIPSYLCTLLYCLIKGNLSLGIIFDDSFPFMHPNFLGYPPTVRNTSISHNLFIITTLLFFFISISKLGCKIFIEKKNM